MELYPQSSLIGPLAFIVNIDSLQTMTNEDRNNGINVNNNDEDLTLFVDDTTLSEVINVLFRDPSWRYTLKR